MICAQYRFAKYLPALLGVRFRFYPCYVGYHKVPKYFSSSSFRSLLNHSSKSKKILEWRRIFHTTHVPQKKASKSDDSNKDCCEDEFCGHVAADKQKKDDFISKQGWNHRLLPKSLIGFQGATFSRGQPHDGVAEGPFAIRETGILRLLREELGQDVVDYGDIPLTDFEKHHHKSRKKTETEKALEKEKKLHREVEPKKSDFERRQRVKTRELERTKGRGKYSEKEMGHNYNKRLNNTVEVGTSTKLISEATSNIMADGRICVTLGGDHSISIGTVNGASAFCKELAILWIDAHTDLHTIHTTASGNFHGTSLSFCILEMQKYMTQLPAFSWVEPKVKAENVAYIGTRSVDPAERAFLDVLGIRTYDMTDIDRMGIRSVIRQALERISPDQRRPVHVSFDVDSLDNLEVISTGTPVPGGLTLREAMVIGEEVYKHGLMMSLDIVELNPEIGTPYDAKRSAECAAKFLYSVLGGVRRGTSDPEQVIPKGEKLSN